MPTFPVEHTNSIIDARKKALADRNSTGLAQWVEAVEGQGQSVRHVQPMPFHRGHQNRKYEVAAPVRV